MNDVNFMIMWEVWGGIYMLYEARSSFGDSWVLNSKFGGHSTSALGRQGWSTAGRAVKSCSNHIEGSRGGSGRSRAWRSDG